MQELIKGVRKLQQELIKGVRNLLRLLDGGKSHREIHRKMSTKYKPQVKYTPPPQPDFEEDYSIVDIGTPSTPPTTPAQEGFILDISNAAEMEDYLGKLNNLRGFEDFKNNPLTSSVKTRLERVNRILSSLSAYNDFGDEEFNFKLANKIRSLAGHMLDIYKDAKTSTELDENSRQQLMTLVEDYLSGIGVTQKIFNVDDDFKDWAILGMADSQITISTKDRALAGKIAAIEVQPHVIVYRNEIDEPTQLIFGGLCRVYKFKED